MLRCKHLTLRAYVELTRPLNSLLSGLGAVLATLAFTDYEISAHSTLVLIVAFTTGFTLTACSMIINDLLDIEVDRVNKPWKPLPRGEASPRIAKILAVTLGSLGVLVNLTAQNPLLVATALAYCTIGVLYSYMRKHWWSHTLVAASTTGPIIYGYIAANHPPSKLELAVLFSTVVYAATMGREILKSIQDYRGDTMRGYATIATKFGVNRALKAMITAGLLASLLALTSTILLRTSTAYKALILVTVIVYTHSLLRAYRDPTPQELEKARRRTLIAMSTGLLAFWLSTLPY
jgi:geranylgeranylglycerol-phosphate geranylgeranyltransferase